MARYRTQADGGSTDTETTERTSDELRQARDYLTAVDDGGLSPDEAAKRALGEIAAHHAAGGTLQDDVREQLRNVLYVDAEEKPHFIDQATALLGAEVSDAAPTDPLAVRATDRVDTLRDAVAAVVETVNVGEEPTTEDLRDLRVAHRELQTVIEDEIAPRVDGAEPWEDAAARIPYGELAQAFGVSLEQLKEADPDVDLDEE